MPRTQINYNKALIYKLCCNDTSITDIYIGSTTNFTKRKYSHHHYSKSCNNRKVYNFINSNGGWNNWSMVLIDYVKCNTSLELRKVEREYIDLLNPSLNSYNVCASQEDKKEKGKQYSKKYYEKNKEQFKEYREKTKEQMKKYREKNKEKRKEYLEKNKEKIKQQTKEHYQTNKEYRIQLYTCPICDSKIQLVSKAQHQRSKKCLNSIIN